jgi:hypothetical protein
VIVRGDPGREESLKSILAALRAGIDELTASDTADVPCDALRLLLIRAGELEQAVSDAPSPSSPDPRGDFRKIRRALRTATSHASSAFHHACESAADGTNGAGPVREALESMRKALDRFPNGGGHGRVWVGVPEGFAFYALFPERYREAARQWAAEHAESPERDVLVVGIRNAGTTLSAVVATTLRSSGWRVRRITVPSGARSPKRRLELRGIRPAAWGLVVDEGCQGSSCATSAVAGALARAGIAKIERLPGHDDTFPLEELRLGKRILPEALWLSIDGGREDPLSRVIACGEGAWRAIRYGADTSWPSVCRALEQPKLLCEGESGRRILFKFAGLATAPGYSSSLAKVHARRLARLAREALTPAPLGTAHGFVATEWLDGRPLEASDASPDLLRRVGGYIAAAAGPPLSEAVARAARNRLETMLCANACEALGVEAANAALALVRPVPILVRTRRSGDGHLAPHEWIVTREGRVLKTDAAGHDLDPTWTGRQPVLWDLAGAVLEWGLDDAASSALLEGFTAGGGERCAPIALDAYGAAYAAHRLGQVRFAADVETDPAERDRLARDEERWRAALAIRLGARSTAEARAGPAAVAVTEELRARAP